MKKYSTIFAIIFAFMPLFTEAGTTSYTTPGTRPFTVPDGVTTVTVKVVGGGGGGGGAAMAGDYWSGFGGGSGGYTIQNIPVTPRQQLTIVVGAGGCAGRYWHIDYAGGDAWAETGVDWTSPIYGGCPVGQYSGGNGGDSSAGSVVATGGHGGLVGGGASYYYGLDSNDGAGGTPNGIDGGSAGNSSMPNGGCVEGKGGETGQDGSGGDGMHCTNGYARPGENGSVTITWLECPVGQTGEAVSQPTTPGIPLYVGVGTCNDGVVSNNPNHLNCATQPVGYTSTVSGGTPLYVGMFPYCNDGVVSNNPNHLNCATQPIGYASTVSGGTPLYVGTVPYCNDGVVSNNPNHLNCATQPIGYTISSAAETEYVCVPTNQPTVNLFFSISP